jgi:hypothetical protein
MQLATLSYRYPWRQRSRLTRGIWYIRLWPWDRAPNIFQRPWVTQRSQFPKINKPSEIFLFQGFLKLCLQSNCIWRPIQLGYPTRSVLMGSLRLPFEQLLWSAGPKLLGSAPGVVGRSGEPKSKKSARLKTRLKSR